MKTSIQISTSIDQDFSIEESLEGNWQMRLSQFDLAERNSWLSGSQSRYPTQGSVMMYWGSEGFGSIFFRRFVMWVSTARSVTKVSRPQTWSSNLLRFNVWPRWRMKLESRKPNFETIPKSEIQMLKMGCILARFEDFKFWAFGFVSDFEIRFSRFPL